MKHDFRATDQYKEKFFMGELWKCQNCSKEHLCTQQKQSGPNCTHTTEFYENCPEINSNGIQV